MKRAFGADHVPVGYADLEAAELVVLVGSNLAWCHPVLFQRLAAAKRARPELKVVVIDPRRTATCELADLHLPLRPGTDAWLLNGLLVELERRSCATRPSSRATRDGPRRGARRRPGVLARPAPWPRPAALDAADVATLYDWFAAHAAHGDALVAGRSTSRRSGTDKGNAVINLHLLTGRIGRPGAGPFSITGQPNAMGGREVGGLANQLAAHVDFDDAGAGRDRSARFWGRRGSPTGPGPRRSTCSARSRDGRIKALWVMATNPAASLPDADRVRDALARLPVRRRLRLRAPTPTRAARPRAAAGRRLGREGRHGHQLRAPDLAASAPSCRRRARRGPTGGSSPRSPAGMGFGDAFAYRRRPRSSASTAALAAGGAAPISASAPLADISDADYDALAPVRWPVGGRTSAVRRRGASSTPTAAPASSP